MIDEPPKIEERENGPLVVRGVTRMVRSDGTRIETKPVMALCRCGGSSNKPFCDGTHARIGFQSRGGTPAGRDRAIPYEGRDVTVHFNPRLCGHAAECGRIAGHVFNDANRPWVQPDEGTRQEVEAVIAACPSGALRLSEPGKAPEHRFDDRAEITVQKNGPYWVQGVAPPVPVSAEGATPRKFVLCRCGKSGAKPFCDGSHRDARWSD